MIPIIFFGTHQFAATILEAVIKSGLFDIKLVITMPDRPAGRHQELQESAVKIIAKKYNLKIDQPISLKNYSPISTPYSLNIIVDYGTIIPQNIIDTPKFGSINLHPSLLPKYRGASPIQSALMAGEKETGISIMLIDDQMDHGPILAQLKFPILTNDTFPTLYEHLAVESGPLLIPTIRKYLQGKIKPQEQTHSQATFTKMLTREDGKIIFENQTAEQIYNLYRGLTPWPGIFTIWNDKRLKLIKIKLANKKIAPGEIKTEDNRIFWGCKNGSVEILELQLEGKKNMIAKEFINGNRL